MRGGDKQEALSLCVGGKTVGKPHHFRLSLRARSWSLVPRCYGRSGHETTTNRRHPRKRGLVHVHTCKQFPHACNQEFAVKDLLDHQPYDGRRNWFGSNNISLARCQYGGMFNKVLPKWASPPTCLQRFLQLQV